MKKILSVLIFLITFSCIFANKNDKIIGDIETTKGRVRLETAGGINVIINLPLEYHDPGKRLVLTPQQVVKLIDKIDHFNEVVDIIRSGNDIQYRGMLSTPLIFKPPAESFIYTEIFTNGSIDSVKFIIRFDNPRLGVNASYLSSVYFTIDQANELKKLLESSLEVSNTLHKNTIALKSAIRTR